MWKHSEKRTRLVIRASNISHLSYKPCGNTRSRTRTEVRFDVRITQLLDSFSNIDRVGQLPPTSR